MPDILSARLPAAVPPSALTGALRTHLRRGHRSALTRIEAQIAHSSDPAAIARLSAQAARLRADIAELEEA